MRSIQILVNYGGALTNEQRILPGVYDADDPRLFGLADHLVEAGHAIALDEPTAPIADVPADRAEWSTLAHQEWAALEGYAPESEPAPAPAPEPEPVDYEAFTVEQLRALCLERGIDLDSLTGSGRDGRLLKADLVAVLAGDDMDQE